MLKNIFIKSWLLLFCMIVGVGSAWADEVTYTFNSKAWGDSENAWTSGKDGNALQSGRGVQITSSVSGANATTKNDFANVSKIVVTYSTNASKGTGSVSIQVGSNTATSEDVTTTGGTTDRTLEYTYDTPQSGAVKLTVSCSVNSIYIKSVAITYNISGGGSPSAVTTTTVIDASGITNTDVYDGTDAGSLSATVVYDEDNEVEGATVTWSGNNDAVATIGAATGAVTLVGKGTVTFTATYAGVEDEYASSSDTYEMTVTDSTPKTGAWQLTDITDLTADDVFVIVGNNGNTYALPSDNGTSSAPLAVAVTIENDEITSDVEDNIKWTISGDAENGYIFYPIGDTDIWLYCTNANNGVRVGTNSDKTFTLDDGYLKHVATSRYVGIYNSQDWRCYTTNTGNITGQSFAIYKYVNNAAVKNPVITVENTFIGSTTATITCSTDGATIYYSFDNTKWTEYTAELTITATTTIYAKAVKDEDESEVVSKTTTKVLPTPTVTIDATGITNTNVYEGTEAGSLAATVTYNEVAVEGAVVTWSGNNDEVATINAETGVVTLVGAGTVTFTATYAGNEDYAENTATYVMTVTNTDPNAPGTENNPYTVAEAIEATPTSGTSANVYIRGIVSAFYASDIMSDGSNYRYYISDDGTTTGQLLVYKGKGEGNVAFSSADDLLIGDEVVILGGLTTYKGEAEVAANNYIFSLNRIEKYAINFVANPAEAGTVEALDGEANEVASGDKFVENTALTISATANTGYTFANWTAEGVELSEVDAAKATLDITMPATDVTLTANFSVNTYALGITSANGTVAVTVNDEEWNGTDEIAYGATVVLTATANTDWAFTSWTAEGVTLDDAAENPVTFTMPASDVLIQANYVDASATYTVLYSVAGVDNEVERKHGAALNLDTPEAINGMAFAGWSTSDDVTAPEFVANDATVTDDMMLFAVFTAQTGTNAYKLVEADQADWRGDYLIAYDNNTFADGRKGGKDDDGSIGKLNVFASPELSDFNGNEIKASWGDTYYVTLEAINDADLSKGYVLKTQDGKYNYQTSNSNGLSCTEYKETAANYPLSVTFKSSSDIEIAISAGAVFHYNTGGYFRFYRDGGQNAVYLYKKVSSDPIYSLGLPSVVTIKAEADYAAFSATQPVSFAETGVTVYTATVMNSANSCYVHLEPVTDGIVPANTGVILNKEVTEDAVINAAAVKCDKSTLDNNELLVSDGTIVGNGSIYALAKKTQGVGFYRVAADLPVPAGKPYLVIPSEQAGAREFFGFNEEGGTPTGISTMHNAEFIMHNNEVYNLNGQRVETLKKGGLYIQNGKKVIVNK
jgi:hypothetical protein